MQNRFSDLNPQSKTTLLHYILHWSRNTVHDESASINKLLPVETSGFTIIAEYVIFYAVLLDDVSLLKDLCMHGADLEKRDRFHRNKTALEVAVDYGRFSLVKTLLDYGAQVPRDISVPSANPCTNPSNFFWSLHEKYRGREVDYGGVHALLRSANQS